MHGTSTGSASRRQASLEGEERKARAKAVRIEDELSHRSIRLSGGQRHLSGPCPKCGGDDRFWVDKLKQSFGSRNCHSRCGDVIDLVQFLDGCNYGAAIDMLVGGRPEIDWKKIEQQGAENERKNREYEKEQLRKALWLWSRRELITGTIAESYLREARGIKGPIPNTLSFLPPYKHHPPAMIAAIGLETLRGVHITNLKADGSGKAYDEETDKLKNKIMIGRNTYGLPIALALPNDGNSLAVTEGIEDGLSVREAMSLGVWVAGCASRMPALADAVPARVGCVTVCADADANGQRYARELARRLVRRRIEVFVDGLVS
jgi:hypothetical protein